MALVLHGYPAPLSSLKKVADFVRNNGYTVVMPEYLTQESFEINKTAEWIKKQLRGQKPDLIIGLSLGGLVMPHVAVNYPKAKLVFTATGERVKPSIYWLNILISLVASPVGKPIIYMLLGLPKNIVEWGYVKAQKITNIKSVKEDLTKRKKETVAALFSMDADRHRQVIEFLRKCDNTDLISKLPNNSLIISGSKDTLMPLSRGQQLIVLLKNGRLVITEGNHYGVMDKLAWEELRKFV